MTTCASCGKENAPHARFCQVCGTAIAQAMAEAESQRPGPDTGILYAGFWIRALALIIDGIIVFTASIILGFASFGTGIVLSIVGPWLYEALMVASTNQATLGKMALGLKVTDESGQQLSFAHATGRHFAKYLSGLPLFAGYIIAAFTERKQALHDLIVNTYVVRNYR
jgi:uncharacterized RDD family membrane protein YckC